MVDLDKDLYRLDLFQNSPIALEFLSPITHLKDFMTYYFTRYVKNLTHTFKNFSTAEVSDFNKRNGNKLLLLFKHPTIQMDDTIIPIPEAMVQTYSKTLEGLSVYLAHTHPDSLEADLKAVMQAADDSSVTNPSISPYTKHDFDDAKMQLGKLYGKHGLTHSVASRVLASKLEFQQVNQQLISMTSEYYPLVLRLNDLVNKVEGHYDKSTMTNQDKSIMSGHLMTLAYRLSIMSTVMNHIQELEHAFVKSLDIFVKKM